MDLTFLLILYLTWLLNLEDLDPNITTLLYTFALVKGKLSQNFSIDIFIPKVKFSIEIWNRTNK